MKLSPLLEAVDIHAEIKRIAKKHGYKVGNSKNHPAERSEEPQHGYAKDGFIELIAISSINQKPVSCSIWTHYSDIVTLAISSAKNEPGLFKRLFLSVSDDSEAAKQITTVNALKWLDSGKLKELEGMTYAEQDAAFALARKATKQREQAENANPALKKFDYGMMSNKRWRAYFKKCLGAD